MSFGKRKKKKKTAHNSDRLEGKKGAPELAGKTITASFLLQQDVLIANSASPKGEHIFVRTFVIFSVIIKKYFSPLAPRHPFLLC